MPPFRSNLGNDFRISSDLEDQSSDQDSLSSRVPPARGRGSDGRRAVVNDFMRRMMESIDIPRTGRAASEEDSSEEDEHEKKKPSHQGPK